MSLIAVFSTEFRGYTVSRTETTFAKEYVGYEGCEAEVAHCFAEDVPPNSVCALYVDRDQRCTFDQLRRLVMGFRAAGFKNITTFASNCFHTSIALHLMKAKCEVGDMVVFSWGEKTANNDGVIVEKTVNGFKLEGISNEISSEIAENPKVRHFIVQMFPTSVKATLEAQYKKLIKKPGLEYKFLCFGYDDHMHTFAWNLFDGGNLNGYLVENFADSDYYFEVYDQKVVLGLKNVKVPYSKTFQMDISNTDTLKFFACSHQDDHVCVKQFDYNDGKRRTVEATFNIEVDHLPRVRVKTIGFETERVVKPIRPAGKPKNTTALVVTHILNRTCLTVATLSTSDTLMFDTFAEMIKYLRKNHPPSTVECVVAVYRDDDHRILLQKAGYTNIISTNAQYFGFYHILHRYKVKGGDGENIAIIFGSIYCILKQLENRYRMLYCAIGTLTAVKLEKYKVTTVIADLLELEQFDIATLGDRNVIISDYKDLTPNNYHSCLWSIVDLGDRLIEEAVIAVFKVSCNGKSELVKTDFVPIPYEKTVEITVGKGSIVRADGTLLPCDNANLDMDELVEIESFDVSKLKSKKIAVTFTVENAYTITAKCVVVPPSRCLYVESTPSGISSSVYSRDYSETCFYDLPSLETILDVFEHPEDTALVLSVDSFTDLEREKLRIRAEQRGFQCVNFVNKAVLTLNSILFGVDTSAFINGKTVLVGGMTTTDANGQKVPTTYVLEGHENKLKLMKIVQEKVGKVYSTLKSVDSFFVAVKDVSKPPKHPAHLKPIFLSFSNEYVWKSLFSKIDNTTSSIVQDIFGFNFIAEWENGQRIFDTALETVPFSREVAIHVGKVKVLKIDTSPLNSEKRELLKGFTFKTEFDRIVVLKLAVDADMKPSVTHVRSDPFPATVFEFTADNRVVVKTEVTDKMEYPAYVSFGSNIVVGETALQFHKENAGMVVYDIHRFFDADFNPEHSDPSWSFKTSPGKDNETIIHIGESKTTSTVCFGTIVSAIKRDVESREDRTLSEIAIRMPAGIVVPENVCSVIGNLLNVKLAALKLE
uniref:DNA helicase n=1 Tax=Panagrellus redivivus TaxID=6233 RepID=A0A7E4ZW74_PANRE